jgi:hypothetical protein
LTALRLKQSEAYAQDQYGRARRGIDFLVENVLEELVPRVGMVEVERPLTACSWWRATACGRVPW